MPTSAAIRLAPRAAAASGTARSTHSAAFTRAGVEAAGQARARQSPALDPKNEVVVFMKDIGLELYAPVLLQQGFDELQTLLDVEEAELRSLLRSQGVPMHCKDRLIRSLQELRSQVDPNNEVVVFLTEIGLEMHAALLLELGFDCLETLVSVEEAELRALLRSRGVPMHHKDRLFRQLQELRSESNSSNEVVIFVREIGLEMHAAVLLELGFDSLEALLAIEEAELRPLLRSRGVPLHHKERLIGSLEELRRQVGPRIDADHPVMTFLQAIGLGQHAKVLIRSGFDDMETLAMVEDRDLKDMGLPAGHVVKLRMHLRRAETTAKPSPSFATPLSGRVRGGLPSAQPVSIAAPTRPLTGRLGGGVVTSGATALTAPSERAKSAVERSWEAVQAFGALAVAESLYRHTFELDPSAMDLFSTDVRQKYREWTVEEGTDDGSLLTSHALKKLFGKFLQAIGNCVAGLSDMGSLVPMLMKLGSRHVGYGVQERHWKTMGRALDLSLRDVLKDSYTPDVQGAWQAVYGFMSSIMIQGLQQARQAQAPKVIAIADEESTSEGSCDPRVSSGTEGCSGPASPLREVQFFS